MKLFKLILIAIVLAAGIHIPQTQAFQTVKTLGILRKNLVATLAFTSVIGATMKEPQQEATPLKRTDIIIKNMALIAHRNNGSFRDRGGECKTGYMKCYRVRGGERRLFPYEKEMKHYKEFIPSKGGLSHHDHYYSDTSSTIKSTFNMHNSTNPIAQDFKPVKLSLSKLFAFSADDEFTQCKRQKGSVDIECETDMTTAEFNKRFDRELETIQKTERQRIEELTTQCANGNTDLTNQKPFGKTERSLIVEELTK